MPIKVHLIKKFNVKGDNVKNLFTIAMVSMFSVGQVFAAENMMLRMRSLSIAPVVDDDKGGAVRVSNDTIPELDISYFVTENFGLELILGTSTHAVTAETIAALGTVSLLPPTLTAQYHMSFGNFKPYVGAGLNYTVFYGEQHGVKDVSYENAMGYALQVGADYKLAENLYFNIDVKKLMLKTDVEVDDGSSVSTYEVELNPWLVGLGVGCKF